MTEKNIPKENIPLSPTPETSGIYHPEDNTNSTAFQKIMNFFWHIIELIIFIVTLGIIGFPYHKNKDQKGNDTDDHEKTRIQEITEFFRDLIIIFVAVIFIRTFVVAPFQISGSSMEESYHDGEFILVNKFSYADFGVMRIGNPARGDVVILRPHASNGKEYYIKRTIGLPGDTIKFEGGNVFLKAAGKTDFVKLSEGYLGLASNGKTFLPMDIKETEFTVPKWEYFVMGDNRSNSSDSRSCFMSCSIPGSTHFVSQSNIVGKLFIDFGYINIFHEGGVLSTGEWKWTHTPRFLSSPKDWVYSELK